MSEKFDPRGYLIKLQGKDYLEVRNRLLWLRTEHPDAIITTELLAHDPDEKWCIVRATVSIPGGGSATGMVRQEPTGVAKDYIANGETSAIGRALGVLGYGTQFAVEFDQEEGAVVDSPVQRRPTAHEASGKPEPKQEPAKTEQAKQPDKAPLPDYLKALWAAKNKGGWTDEQLRALMARRHPGLVSTRDLTEEQAVALRSHMQRALVARERMDQLWGVQEIADTLAEYDVRATIDMSDEQLTSLEALMSRARRDIGVVGELAQAMR